MKAKDFIPGKLYTWNDRKDRYFCVGKTDQGQPCFQKIYPDRHSPPFINNDEFSLSLYKEYKEPIIKKTRIILYRVPGSTLLWATTSDISLEDFKEKNSVFSILWSEEITYEDK